MKANDIIKEIQRLPLSKRIYVVEKTIYSIRKEAEKENLKKAANELLSDYQTDENLTIFTEI
ncbi:MAG: hypothetical protein WCS11_08300 [Dysgonamonadaceae bacterium]|jgi:hypothetical protein|nr:hypothetical protein [Dysgonamonadaceae bacterium]